MTNVRALCAPHDATETAPICKGVGNARRKRIVFFTCKLAQIVGEQITFSDPVQQILEDLNVDGIERLVLRSQDELECAFTQSETPQSAVDKICKLSLPTEEEALAHIALFPSRSEADNRKSA